MTVQIETAPATDVRVSGTPEPVAVPDQRTGSRRLGSTIDASTPEDTGRPELSAEDLDAQSPAADLVRVYLNGIGKTALLTAAQEVDLAKRIEAGVFAKHVLDSAAAEGAQLDRQYAADLRADRARRRAGAQPPARGQPAAGRLAWPSATPAAGCRCST